MTGALVSAVLAAGMAFAVSGGAARADALPPTFNGTATSGGVRVTLTATGIPATSTPIDGGGPTAIAQANSYAGGNAYASFPDPGQFVVSLPSLGAGLFSAGAAGLPPFEVPFVPEYPFSVAADANTKEQRAGDGAPYLISARSTDTQSTAEAIAGLAVSGAGSGGLIRSVSTVGPTPAGGAQAQGSSVTTGFAVGPLTIGEITSTATQTMDAAGTLTPTTDLRISGLRIGGSAVGIGPEALNTMGTDQELPINASLAQLLDASGITVKVLAAKTYPDKHQVVSPGLQITFPFSSPYVQNFGEFVGTATMVFGSTTAKLVGSVPTPGPGLGLPGATGATGDLGAAGSGNATMPDLSAAPSGVLPQFGNPPADAVALLPRAASNDGGAQLTAALTPLTPRQVDLQGLYLLVLAGALIALGFGVLIQRSGLRTWIATRS